MLKRLAVLLLFPSIALAWYPSGEPSFFNWTEPTQRTDGTPLAPAGDISAYTLRCTNNGVDALSMVIGTGGQNQWMVPEGTFFEGTWVCKLYATDQEARMSDGSNAVEFLVQTYKFTVAPAAPSGLGVG